MKRLMSLLVAFALLLGLAIPVFADSLDTSRKGSITLNMSYGDVPVPGGTIKIYRVASVREVNGKTEFVPLENIKPCVDSFDSSNIHSAITAYTIAAYIANDYKYIPTAVKDVDENGIVTFEDLSLGIYLVYQLYAADGYLGISPFLVTVPSSDFGYYLYDIDIDAKVPINTRPNQPPGSVDPPGEDPDNPKDPDDPDNPKDPDNPNYPPYDPDDPTYDPDEPTTDEDVDDPYDPDDPVDSNDPDDIVEADPELPQTGQLNWPIPVLVIAGLVLFMIGWSLFFKPKRDTNES